MLPAGPRVATPVGAGRTPTGANGAHPGQASIPPASADGTRSSSRTRITTLDSRHAPTIDAAARPGKGQSGLQPVRRRPLADNPDRSIVVTGMSSRLDQHHHPAPTTDDGKVMRMATDLVLCSTGTVWSLGVGLLAGSLPLT